MTHPFIPFSGMQTKRILSPGHLYTAAAALYSILLIAWWPEGVGQICKEVYHSCSPLPDVSAVPTLLDLPFHLSCAHSPKAGMRGVIQGDAGPSL